MKGIAEMDADEIVRKALDGNAVLFLGAGFSRGANNILDEEFMIGEGLCKKLIDEGNIDVSEDEERDKEDLGYISDRFLENNTKHDLIKLLKGCYSCKKLSTEQSQIAEIDWRRIYTTNYDDVMELASRKVGKLREPICPKKKISEVYGKDSAVIHINGYIGNLTEETLEAEFKLLNRSYRRRTIPDNDWAIMLHNDIRNADCVIFVGYSLDYDLELQQIFASDTGLKSKCLFVTLKPKNRTRKLMSTYGIVYEEGTTGFCEKIKECKNEYVPEDRKYELHCVDELFSPNNLSTNVTNKNMIDLFISGKVDDEIVYSAFGYEYLVKRDYVKEACDFLSQDGKVVIVHSDLANGKTVFIKEMERELNQIGRVYQLNELNSKFADDLEEISENKGNQFIIIEDYNQYMDYNEWDILKRYKYSNIKYIFSARSYINDNFYGRLVVDFSLSREDLKMYDINVLSEEEEKGLCEILSNYNVWDKNANFSFSQKRKYIENKCAREIRNVLLDLYESEQIRDRINKSMQSICKNRETKYLLLMALINKIMSLNMSISDICLILNENINIEQMRKSTEITEFIGFRGTQISLKSSVIALHILQTGNYNDDVLDMLCKIVSCLVNHVYINRYKSVLRLIISFSSIRLVFNRKDKSLKQKYIKFYENARKTKLYEKNPFFWVQYALAVMDVKDYTAAEVYLNMASAFSMSKFQEDSYQIESLRARLLLEKTIEGMDYENAYQNFRDAHRLICSNKTPEKHYPFKQVSKYIIFYDRFYSKFSRDEQVDFMYKCTEIKKKIDDYLNGRSVYEKNLRQKHREIKRIALDLEKVIKKMAGN